MEWPIAFRNVNYGVYVRRTIGQHAENSFASVTANRWSVAAIISKICIVQSIQNSINMKKLHRKEKWRKQKAGLRFASLRTTIQLCYFGEAETLICGWPFDITHLFSYISSFFPKNSFWMWLKECYCIIYCVSIIIDSLPYQDMSIHYIHLYIEFDVFRFNSQCLQWYAWQQRTFAVIYTKIVILLFRWVKMKAHQLWILAAI